MLRAPRHASERALPHAPRCRRFAAPDAIAQARCRYERRARRRLSPAYAQTQRRRAAAARSALFTRLSLRCYLYFAMLPDMFSAKRRAICKDDTRNAFASRRLSPLFSLFSPLISFDCYASHASRYFSEPDAIT
jgi:hypothetical protein